MESLMKEEQQQIIEHYITSYNAFDVEGMLKNLDSEVIFENTTNGKVDLRTKGIQEFKEQAEASKHYFTQRKQRILSWRFKESHVSIEIDYQAVLAIDLPNGMKAGDLLELKGVSEFEFDLGKIKKITDNS
ncbi:nuclear transport factor 2-like protein [Spongiimicrobium salis]|uniref:nuclear transport factor 2 family protein n=1 Tax=Spongiimicrobium salis TaxID=1667022 RepID=UPI00374C9425